MRSSTGHCSATVSRVGSLLVGYAAFFAGIVAAVSVSAQDTPGTGALSGTIRNDAGVPVAFATICLSQTMTCAVADERGAFRILNIRTGRYALEAAAPATTTLPLGFVDVRAGIDQRLEVVLPSREKLETIITVSASGAAVPKEVKASGYLITSREIFNDAGSLQDVSRYVQTQRSPRACVCPRGRAPRPECDPCRKTRHSVRRPAERHRSPQLCGYTWNRRANAREANEQLGVFPLIGFEWRF